MVRLNSMKMFIDGFLSQDNETDDRTTGNQLAGIDLRWKVLDLPCDFMGRSREKMKTIFLPEALFFQYGIEGWKDLGEQHCEFLLSLRI